MNIEKRGSTYRVRMMIDGRRYSVTLDHKPTEKESYNLIMKKVDTDTGIKGTFNYFCKEYIAVKENVLSPRTVREYINTVKYIPEWFLGLNLGEIKASDVQRCVNEISVGRSPKTVRNYHGFIAGVIGMYRPDFVLNTTLPQRKKQDNYIPTAEDVKRILELANDENRIFLKLACMGLRRSEICALSVADLDENNILHINKALVLDKDNNFVVKSTKTTASTRDVPIPKDLADEIRKQGFVYRQSPNNVIKWLNRTQDQLGIPRFALHKLRHFFASTLAEKNVPAKTIMSLGGWETDAVMKTVYQHNMKKEEEKRQIIDDLTSGIF